MVPCTIYISVKSFRDSLYLCPLDIFGAIASRSKLNLGTRSASRFFKIREFRWEKKKEEEEHVRTKDYGETCPKLDSLLVKPWPHVNLHKSYCKKLNYFGELLFPNFLIELVYVWSRHDLMLDCLLPKKPSGHSWTSLTQEGVRTRPNNFPAYSLITPVYMTDHLQIDKTELKLHCLVGPSYVGVVGARPPQSPGSSFFLLFFFRPRVTHAGFPNSALVLLFYSILFYPILAHPWHDLAYYTETRVHWTQSCVLVRCTKYSSMSNQKFWHQNLLTQSFFPNFIVLGHTEYCQFVDGIWFCFRNQKVLIVAPKQKPLHSRYVNQSPAFVTLSHRQKISGAYLDFPEKIPKCTAQKKSNSQ